MRFFILLFSFFFLWACEKNETPLNISPQNHIPEEAKDYFDQMNVQETDGHKGQIILHQSGEIIWFGSIKNLIMYTQLPETANQPFSAFVSLKTSPDWQWIEAQNAFYLKTPKPEMGKHDFLIFNDESSVQKMIQEKGGTLLKMNEIRQEDLLN